MQPQDVTDIAFEDLLRLAFSVVNGLGNVFQIDVLELGNPLEVLFIFEVDRVEAVIGGLT